MASKRMAPHQITLYNYLGEDEDGHAIYNCTLLQNVHVFHGEGVTATNAAADAPHVHIFDDLVIALPNHGATLDRSLYNLSPDNLKRALETPEGEKPFIPWDEWNKTTDREQYWSLSPEGKDYFAIGDKRAEGNLLPTSLILFRITSIARREMGSKRMWHWRIEAR